MVEVEKLGIPTVTAVSTEFEALARSSAQSFGVAEMCMVPVPHPMGMIPLEEIRAKADTVFPELLKGATEWKPSGAKLAERKPTYPAEVFEFEGSEVDVNDLFFKNGWSLGLPIIPPTPERVAEMLKGTSHKPDEVLGLMPPRVGAVTVELVAVHAVMAGCKPEYMPILLAGTSALANEAYRSGTTTTHPTAPYFIVNGPIRDEIGLAYGVGAAGPEYKANVSISMALNSIAEVIGGSKPPDGDKATLGWPGNTLPVVIGENEEANPFGPLHVEKGFKKEDNILTVQLGADIPSNINDHNSVKGEDLLTVIASEMKRGGQNSRFLSKTDVMVILSPEHAATLYNDGWTSKDKIRQFLFEAARNPVKWQPAAGASQIGKDVLGTPATPDTLAPIVAGPEYIQILVAGGPGKHSQYVGTGPSGGKLVSVKIDDWK